MKTIKLTVLALGLLTASYSFGQEKKVDEVKQKKQFAKADLDSNGFISLDEMKTKFEGKKTKAGEPFNVEKMFNRKDANGDSQLSLVEYFAKPKKGKGKKKRE
ncbi:hypothetical protein [Algibacter sp.]|uniref:hypothetical protein n=1 Tax=Algibacter sp. TaxID=1872428 RepID=UPI003C720383